MSTLSFKPCPLCEKEVKGYLLGLWGMIRCDPCKLRMEHPEGLEAAAELWNKRAGELSDRDRDKVLKILDEGVTEGQSEGLKPSTLDSFIKAQIGPYYIAARAQKNGQGKRISQADHDRYKKLFESTRRT